MQLWFSFVVYSVHVVVLTLSPNHRARAFAFCHSLCYYSIRREYLFGRTQFVCILHKNEEQKISINK